MFVPAIVLLPTPPFADDTATTFFTSFMLLLCGSPRCIRGNCGGAPERGRPWMTISLLLDCHNPAVIIPEDSHAADNAVSRIVLVSTLRVVDMVAAFSEVTRLLEKC
jgi:hypothetical protein